LVGAVALAFSIYYASSILAFIGLGLVFWGAILFALTPTKLVKLELLNAVASPALSNIDRVIVNSDLSARGIYLPPRYLKDFESSLVFIPSKDERTLPKPEEVEEEKLYSKTPNGVFLTPPGIALAKIFEKEIGTSFTKTDLNYVQENLPKLFVEDLEIAEETDVETENNTFTVRITNHIFKDVCEEARKHQKLRETVGCPLCSAIACALAKATGELVTIEGEELSKNGKTIKIRYRILKE